jgi:hypothetical protein
MLFQLFCGNNIYLMRGIDGIPATRAGTTAPAERTCVPIRFCFTPSAAEASTRRAASYVAATGPVAMGKANLFDIGRSDHQRDQGTFE